MFEECIIYQNLLRTRPPSVSPAKGRGYSSRWDNAKVCFMCQQAAERSCWLTLLVLVLLLLVLLLHTEEDAASSETLSQQVTANRHSTRATGVLITCSTVRWMKEACGAARRWAQRLDLTSHQGWWGARGARNRGWWEPQTYPPPPPSPRGLDGHRKHVALQELSYSATRFLFSVVTQLHLHGVLHKLHDIMNRSCIDFMSRSVSTNMTMKLWF